MVPIIIEFAQTGLVPRLPTAVLSMGLMIIAFLSLTCGLVLDTVTRGRREMKRMRYLNIPAPGNAMPASRRNERMAMKKLSAAQRKLAVQFFKFGLVGIVGFIVDVSVLTFCMRVRSAWGLIRDASFPFWPAPAPPGSATGFSRFRGRASGHAGHSMGQISDRERRRLYP